MSNVNTEVSACDREPIHIPGSIQPHGILFVADAETLDIVAAAGAIEDRLRLSPDWLGTPIGDVIGGAAHQQLEGMSAGSVPLILDETVEGVDERYTVVCHRAGRLLMVELEPAATGSRGTMRTLGELDMVVRGFEQAPTTAVLCEQAVAAFRRLTGFDRVMIYQFVDDDAGRVVAEDRDPALHSFLNHHFPASDIPRQARALYIRNRARAIPDVDYVPAQIQPAGLGQLDLSDVGLRSVSPIHLQYLRNMGVKASASFSIVCDGALWGLVACHHNSPHGLPREVAVTGTALANALARQIRAKDQTAIYDERLRLRIAVDELADQISEEHDAARAFEDIGDALRRVLDADGFAFFGDGVARLYGTGPDEAELTKLAEWAMAHGSGGPVVTRRLLDLYPPAAAWPERASGLLLLPMVQNGQSLLWLRVEQPEEVRWAGDPHKPVQGEPGTSLTPRASFATWVEMVRGRSRRWTLEEADAGQRFLRLFIEVQANREIRRLNGELQQALADRDALLKQKELLMREVDHRVQNSLQLVGAHLTLQAREAGPGPVAEHLAGAQARLSAVSRVHRRLYRAEQRETIDLGQYLGELLDDLRAALGPDWEPFIQAEFVPLLLPTDRAMPIGLVMTELVLNASKYAYQGKPGPIYVQLVRQADTVRLTVTDQGQGRKAAPRSDSGFGSRMVAATVTRVGGTLEHDDRAQGLTVVLSFPVAI